MSYNKRFEDSDWYKSIGDKMVTIGGVGGIGSYAAFFLARTGVQLLLYDFDTIEGHNIGGQLYSRNQIGQPKLHALRGTIGEFTPFSFGNIMPRGEKITEDTQLVTNICIAAFDNMKARADLYTAWTRKMEQNEYDEGLFIDGRLLMESFEVFTVDWKSEKQKEEYKKYTFKDSEAADIACTAKATSHCGGMIGTMITALVINWITNKYVYKDDIRVVPFRQNVQLELFNFETHEL